MLEITGSGSSPLACASQPASRISDEGSEVCEPGGAIVETRGDGYALNRTAFYQALKTEFEAYVQELNDSSKPELRKRFFKKLNDVASEC